MPLHVATLAGGDMDHNSLLPDQDTNPCRRVISHIADNAGGRVTYCGESPELVPIIQSDSTITLPFMKGGSQTDFRLWRQHHGWTQFEAAMRLGYSRGVIQLYDEGKKEPPLVMLLAMLAISEGLSLDEKPWAKHHLPSAA